MKSIANISFSKLSVLKADGQPVFDNVSLDLPMGRVVHVQGLSGSGRSLFLKLMNGLVDPSEGEVMVSDRNLADFSYHELQQYRLLTGYSFDFGGLLSNRTLKENLSLPLLYHSCVSPLVAKERVDLLLDLFKIDSAKANCRPSDVQGSIRKAISVARAFIFAPQLLLLDDPTTGLNKDMKQALTQLINASREDKLKHLFITTDDKEFIESWDHETLKIEACGIFKQDSLAEKKLSKGAA